MSPRCETLWRGIVLTILSENFALLEAGYVVVRMLQKFKSFELDPTEKDIAVGTEKQDLTIVLASSNGCRVCATSES